MGESSSTNLFATKQRSDAGAMVFSAGQRDSRDPGVAKRRSGSARARGKRPPGAK
ncbi:hypothetical protein QWY14_03345 [Planococcus sp. N028]|uniref:Uncharacterized protein n=1 Tax=Planococcus shixiaomingii TaxID=3058393 RepID=A0ABT8MYT6_9BACL|nr:hypothetical protein [Planococcus sp. N028]MDN7240806.1 hypothetical protein [Planococcus sp. N028]